MSEVAEEAPERSVKQAEPSKRPSHKIFRVGRNEPVPKGAVLLSTQQVQDLQTKIIKQWTPSRELLPLRHGAEMLGGLSALSGAVFLSHFRRTLLLGPRGLISAMIPSLFFPAVSTSMLQQGFVRDPIMSGEYNCALCMQIRASTIQLIAGVFQPILLAVLSSSALAKTSGSYALPSLTQPHKLIGVYVQMLQPIRMRLAILVGIHFLSGSIIAYRQAIATVKVNGKLLETMGSG